MDRHPLISELRYKADSWVWNDVLIYFCREAAEEDRQIATKLNRLCEELLVLCEKRRNIAHELRIFRSIVVISKASEFVAESVTKANDQAVLEKEMYIQKIVGNMPRERAREIDLFVQDLRREDRLRRWFFGMALCKVRVFYLLIDTANIGTHCDVVMSKVLVEPRHMQLFVAIW
ncbi:hypothetical protein Tco_1179674 [Tanacetum coccineum]